MSEGGSDFPEDERDPPFSDNSANLISFDIEEMVNVVNEQTEDIVTSCLHEMYRTSGNRMTPELQNILTDPQRFAVINDLKKKLKTYLIIDILVRAYYL